MREGRPAPEQARLVGALDGYRQDGSALRPSTASLRTAYTCAVAVQWHGLPGIPAVVALYAARYLAA